MEGIKESETEANEEWEMVWKRAGMNEELKEDRMRQRENGNEWKS